MPRNVYGGLRVTADQLLVLGLTLVAVIALHLFLSRSTLGRAMRAASLNPQLARVSGIDPESITEVIELPNNLEVGKLDYLAHPEKLTNLPPNEPIGIGPGGEQYFKQTELPPLPDDIDPSVRAVVMPDKPDRPGIILGRELAKTLHVYVGDEVTLVSPPAPAAYTRRRVRRLPR